eukprot:5505272-Prymnesium_polylepis.2
MCTNYSRNEPYILYGHARAGPCAASPCGLARAAASTARLQPRVISAFVHSSQSVVRCQHYRYWWG